MPDRSPRLTVDSGDYHDDARNEEIVTYLGGSSVAAALGNNFETEVVFQKTPGIEAAWYVVGRHWGYTDSEQKANRILMELAYAHQHPDEYTVY
jgi:hypothetical protein